METPPGLQGSSAVAIWLVDVPDNADAACFAVCETLLDPSERDAAGRFRLEPARRLYVAAHALARMGLSSIETTVSPAAWMFDRGPFGKPAARGAGPYFNLSHTEDLVAVAVCPSGEVGLDVERHDRPIDPASMAAVLSQAEQAELARLRRADQSRRFWEIWTAKEAYAKASGRGISAELKNVRVRMTTAGDGVRHGQIAGWHVHQFDAGGHWLAVASHDRARPRVARINMTDLARLIREGGVLPVPESPAASRA